jgi:GntR family transcriptional repressor for pyruvate dehydrogenase complex
MTAARSKLEPVPRPSTVDLIVDRIRQHIDAEQLQSGDRLPGELELVQELGVSRPILREAMTRLESLGVVTVQRGRGTFVADRDDLGGCVRFIRSALAIAPKDLVQFAELRTLVECFAARRAAEQATPNDVAELAAFCEEMDREGLDYLDAVRVDFQFHRRIVALSGNVLLQNLIEVIHEYVMAGMVHTTPKPRDHRWSRPLHAAILKAIRDGDGDAAEKAMKRHMDSVVLRLTAAAEEQELAPKRGKRRG